MQDTNQTQTTTPPIISINKEQGPMITSPSESPAETAGPEITESPTPEIKIPQELKEIVEKSPPESEVKINHEATLAGVTPAGPLVPVINTPTGTIKLPMTYPQALQKTKQTGILDSSHWLAAIILYEWSKHEPDLVKELKHSKTPA